MNSLLKITCLFMGVIFGLLDLGAHPFSPNDPRLLAYGAILHKIKEKGLIETSGTPVFIINDGARWQGIEICKALQLASKDMIFLPYDYHSIISEVRGPTRLLEIAYRLNVEFVSSESGILIINVSFRRPNQYFPDYLMTLQFSANTGSYKIVEEGGRSFFYKEEPQSSSVNLPD